MKKKIVEETIQTYINENLLDDTNSIPVYRIRMVGDIEFNKNELEEYMVVNGLDKSDLRKGALGLAKVKWKNRITKALNDKDISLIDDKNFKWNVK